MGLRRLLYDIHTLSVKTGTVGPWPSKPFCLQKAPDIDPRESGASIGVAEGWRGLRSYYRTGVGVGVFGGVKIWGQLRWRGGGVVSTYRSEMSRR